MNTCITVFGTNKNQTYQFDDGFKFSDFWEKVTNDFGNLTDFKLKHSTRFLSKTDANGAVTMKDLGFQNGFIGKFDLIFGLKGGFSAQAAVVSAEEVTKVFNEVVVQNMQTCSNNSGVTQVFQVNGNANNISDILLTQESNINFGCFGETQTQVDILNDIINKLTSLAETKSEWSPQAAIGVSANYSKISNDVVTKAMVSNIQGCSVNIPVSQIFQINGDYNSVVAVTLHQDTNVISKCVFGSNNMVQLTNKISNDLTATASSSSTLGLSFTMIIIVAIVLLVVILLPIIARTAGAKQASGAFTQKPPTSAQVNGYMNSSSALKKVLSTGATKAPPTTPVKQSPVKTPAKAPSKPPKIPRK
jgi:hypothetical protein